jgi:hypothetical protein
VLLDDHSMVDLDDMFGVRRALALLPERLHDVFIDNWRALTEAHPGNVVAIRAAVARRATRPFADGVSDPCAAAWKLVSDAMTNYLAWRDDVQRLATSPVLG